ncbi:MAG TPA: hypothetical protein VKT99_20335 [Xanthobacteraceae bacterium]|jgi:hypothetical protein|nr:hypothetical protein [Xanthobacteraceae bacterium]
MDEDRKIRFLVPPTLFLVSLLWGAWFDSAKHDWVVNHVFQPDWPKLIGLVAGGSLVVFVGGYIIGTLTHFILRKCSIVCGHSSHEVVLNEEALTRVLQVLHADSAQNERERRRQELFAGVMFDHGILRERYEGIHKWLFRRWTGFNIAAASVTALILSLAFGTYVFHITITFQWCIPVVGFAILLAFVGRWAWRDTMQMLEFMARLLRDKEES